MLRSDYWYRFPWLLVAAALILVGLGLAGIYAATDGRADCPDKLRGLAEKQVVFLAISLAVFLLTLAPSYVRLAHYSYALYGVSIALLAMLAVMRRFDLELPGIIYPTNNAYSWISIPGVMKFQPSELTKIAFIMALAYYLRYRKNYRTFRGLLTPFVMALVPTALVLYQPDLGTAMMFLPVLFLMLFAAGARRKHLLAIILMGLAMVPVFYSSMKGYQRMRIDSWLLSGCAERMRFALAEHRDQAADQAAAASERGASEPAAPEPAAEAAGDVRTGQDSPQAEDTLLLPQRAREVQRSREAKRFLAPALTADEQAQLAQEITSMWRFRLWRLATAVSWGKDKAEFVLARQRLFEALDAGPGPESFSALRMFFGSLLNDPGHQLFQAKIAVGAGGLTGQGWLGGTQTRYGFLPQAHTDFLFPTLAEEFGLLGALGVVLLYGLLCILGLDVSFSTTEPYGKLLVVGVVGLVAAQSFLNMAMSIGLMPITGIPLPFMSYGGSSLLSSFLALGLLCNVALRRLFLIAPRPFEWRE
ncbi:MAG: FtsW/RodA/SpoVE family cell cycle protein [Planctomycetota bacterium]|nr:FtsW/RodA/SpoVE family cell cycle protein [Planctomycetota bacterium]